MKIVKGAAWSDLSDEEKRKLIESVILTMTVDLDKKRIIDIEYEQDILGQKIVTFFKKIVTIFGKIIEVYYEIWYIIGGHKNR